jgi:uncharacterized hydrophobic protein (TIGR00271 family)
LWIPLEVLSRVSGLLYLLVLMAINLTLTRRPRLKDSSHFRLPFHPWAPALTLALDVMLIPLWGLQTVAWGVISLSVGVLIYLVYGRRHHIEAQEGITIFHPPMSKGSAASFRVLVPIANPDTAGSLLRLANWIAQAHDGEVLALQVVVVPHMAPLETGRKQAQTDRMVLERALELAAEEGIPLHTMTRVAHSVAQGILDTADEEGADLIILGWRGLTRSRAASLGPIVDTVLRDAPCDVLITVGKDAGLPRRILLPTSGGPHARAATRLTVSLSRAHSVEATLLYVQTSLSSGRRLDSEQHSIEMTLTDLDLDPGRLSLQQKVIEAPSVTAGIIAEAQQHDMVMLGVSDESLLDRFVFGSVPMQVAAHVSNLVLVQGYRGVTGLWTRRILRLLRDVLPTLNQDEQLTVQRELARAGRPGVDYFVLIVLSCIIATLGLLLDSPAVVIGAMLVAPLMSPIMTFSLGLVIGNLRLIRFSTEAILKGVALAVTIAAFVGLLSPLKIVTAEMSARGRPTLLDMAVALISGMAGAYALARKNVSAALPGVAIAAALMPPLATVGLSLSMGNVRVASGAFLLFAANIAAISLASGTVFLLLGIRPQKQGPESRLQLRRRMIGSLLLLLVIAVPLGVIMANVVREATMEHAAEEILARRLSDLDSQLMDLRIKRVDNLLVVSITIHSHQPLEREQDIIDDLAKILSAELDHPVRVEATVLPVIRSER